MWRDFTLAPLHHVLMLGLVAMLASEMALLRGSPGSAAVQRPRRLDAAYGATAVVLLAIGLVRVYHGIKGADFYLHNPWFHAKVGAFLLAALLSLAPAITFARWCKAQAVDPGALPSEAAWNRARLFVRTQFALLIVIVIAAAGVSRYGGL